MIRFDHMRKIKSNSVIIFLIFIIGCTAPEPSATLPSDSTTTIPQSTLSPFELPTATKRNTFPATHTATPELGLRTNGPFFAYFRQVDGEYQFVLMDADGMGRKIIPISTALTNSLSDTLSALDTNLVSPDGNWLAVYTGRAGEPGIFPPQGAFDLSLSLLNLSTGELQVITSVLSDNYPNNFKQAAERLSDPSIIDVELYNAFLAGLGRSLAWSPDGRFLAFAGQMEGLSSDLYIYDLQTKIFRRLSSGDQEVQSIEWSPDGKWVLYSNTYKVGADMEFDIYVVDVDGLSAKHLSTATSNYRMWANQHTYIEHDNENVVGDFGLRMVDVRTGQIRKIWDGPVMMYSLNRERAKFVFATHLFSHSPNVNIEPDPNFVPGLYLLDLKTYMLTNIKIPDDIDFSGNYFITPFNLMNNVFVFTGYDYDQKPYLLSDSAGLTELDSGKISEIIVSPDSNYWVAITDKTVDVYSADNALLNSISLPFQDPQYAFITWRQDDSSGLFAIEGANVYYLNVVSGEVMLLESNFIKPLFSAGYSWINEK